MYPSLSQFLRWASQYRAVPIWIEPALPQGAVLEWVHNLLGASQKFFFLHSASSGPQARYSYVSLEPPRQTLESRGGELTVRLVSDNGARFEALKIGNPF